MAYQVDYSIIGRTEKTMHMGLWWTSKAIMQATNAFGPPSMIRKLSARLGSCWFSCWRLNLTATPWQEITWSGSYHTLLLATERAVPVMVHTSIADTHFPAFQHPESWWPDMRIPADADCFQSHTCEQNQQKHGIYFTSNFFILSNLQTGQTKLQPNSKKAFDVIFSFPASTIMEVTQEWSKWTLTLSPP